MLLIALGRKRSERIYSSINVSSVSRGTPTRLWLWAQSDSTARACRSYCATNFLKMALVTLRTQHNVLVGKAGIVPRLFLNLPLQVIVVEHLERAVLKLFYEHLAAVGSVEGLDGHESLVWSS